MAVNKSVTLSNGAQLSVDLTQPASGATYLIPAGATGVDVPVGGGASIGKGAPNVHWTYVIDVSGSTGTGCGASGGTVLDCEKTAVTHLNDTVDGDGSAVDVGLSVFAESAASADMSPASGEQPLALPASPDVDTVIASVAIGGVGQFTPHSVGASTNFTAGLQAALVSVNASSAVSKHVVFLSDGQSNEGTGFDAAVSALHAAGATIHSFAVGAGSSCTGGTAGTLQQMAASTGGTCTPVPNPADLPQIVQNVTATRLSSLSVTVDGAATGPVSLTPPLPLDGPASTQFAVTAAHQLSGVHEACATAGGSAGSAGSPGSATACNAYAVLGFVLNPVTATNELGRDHTHTVTATVAGPADKLAGWPVSFTVTGTNATAAGTCLPADCRTASDGTVTFTYSVPVASSSLGQDGIGATITVNGTTGTRQVAKTWVDTTPPAATCVPGPNSDGTIPSAPGNGGQGQNQDGFYTVSAVDDVSAKAGVKVYVEDAGSGHVFGPYADPTNIKYTQANGATPSETPGTGAVNVILKGKGDAKVHAIDGSGNRSTAVSCLVPPSPK